VGWVLAVGVVNVVVAAAGIAAGERGSHLDRVRAEHKQLVGNPGDKLVEDILELVFGGRLDRPLHKELLVLAGPEKKVVGCYCTE